jgi:alpha-mannosidase
MDSLIANTPSQVIPPRVERLRGRIAGLVWGEARPLAVSGSPVLDAPVGVAAARRLRFAPVTPGERFGPPAGNGQWQQRWFRLRVPAGHAEDRLFFTCGGEHTLWHGDEPWAGIDLRHPWCDLPPGGGELLIDTGCYMTGIGGMVGHATRTGDALPHHDGDGLRFQGACLRRRDTLAWKTLWQIDALWQLCRIWLEDAGYYADGPWRTPRRDLRDAHPLLRPTLHRLAAAADAFDRDGLSAAAPLIAAARRAARGEAWQPAMAVVGHAHIDLPFMWPVAEAERKAVHTAATAVRLCERDPRFRFAFSQPALWEAVRRRAPALHRRLAALARAGRVEAVGGAWCEGDTQLPCGEALARNLLHGIAYTRALTGTAPTVLWLPDCFGFSACLPSVMHQVGLRGFFSIKMFWSQLTPFPYHSWRWRGPDGAEVVGHTFATGDYSLDLDLAQARQHAREFRQGHAAPELLAPVGHGDGGGGPTEEHLARAAEAADLADVPRCRWSSVEGFFGRLRRRADALPVFDGEIHLERHQGTWSGQRRLKTAYRHAELAMQTHEAARALRGQGPAADADWQELVRHQFHDLIAGTTIPQAIAEGEAGLKGLADRLRQDTRLPGRGCWNPLAVARSVLLPERDEVHAFPALGASQGALPTPIWTVGADQLSHDRVTARFDRSGALISLAVDGVALPLGGPVHLAHGPNPTWEYDAWELHRENSALVKPVVTGRPRLAWKRGASAAISVPVRIGASHGELRWVLIAGETWLRLELDLDWRERQHHLRLVVPVATRARHARFGGPFGSVLRAQQPDGAASEGLYESCATRWASLGDRGEVGLVAEAGWGFGAREGVLHHTLLRASIDPDPQADQGAQRIRCAVGPGAEAALAAETLYAPLADGAGRAPWLTWHDHGTLVPSWTVGDGAGGLIVRLHEVAGSAGTALVSAPGYIADLVDLGGRRVGRPRREDVGWRLAYGANAILGLRLRPA